MADDRFTVSVFRNVQIAIDRIKQMPSSGPAGIHVQATDFREAISIRMVASELGISVRQLRRLVASGAFPASHIQNGQKQLWLKTAVREWKKFQIENGKESPPKKGSRVGLWGDLKRIEKADDQREARLHPDTRMLNVDQREMRALLASDPKEFERRYPNLRGWLKEKGLR
ncbi:helix-turn-helix transcriptional regulator [Sphingomonas melonis]|jgi:predicted DNA-binding transcriptional regulator AlpA|nr:hypothetical protein [Sphingomonas melonis]